MSKESVVRLRSAFARVALDLLDQSASPSVTAAFPPPFSTMSEADWRRAIALWREHAADLLAALPSRPCPACGSATSRWLFESYDAHAFHECTQCGCWFTPKVVDWAVFERLFERSPEARTHAVRMMGQRDEAGLRDIDMTRIGGYLDDLLPMLPRREGQTLAYLDAGCGVGHSLRAGQARGLTVQGVDVDDAAVELARADGLPVVFLSEAETLPRGPYHLLSFWETLEHIAEPLQTLERFVPYLAEDGLVAITVPNLNAPATRTLREACTWVHGGYNTPGHVNLFHAPALARLLARAGLTLLDADGQFSGNPVELVAFLSGATRGAFDALDPSLPPHGTFPVDLGDALTELLPALSLFERIGLLSPILAVVACRQGQEAVFAPAVAARRAQRRQRVADEARQVIAFEVDYKARSEALQHEVDRRDALLVTRTDELQHEIDRRDQLLQEAHARLNRTIEARSLTAMRGFARLAGWLGIRGRR